jgi:hypothetical protein
MNKTLIVFLLFFGVVRAKVEIPFGKFEFIIVNLFIGNECFDQVDHRGISNALPVSELWNVSPFDCLQHCISNAGSF